MGQNLRGKIVPWWKRSLSYLSEVHIESRSSVYNPHLYVSMKHGRYMLSTDKAIYSYADKYENFKEVFSLMDLSRIKRVLILGFGLGSIPYMLEKVFHFDMQYTGIEIDEEVIYLASKYVLTELHSDIEIINTDAALYVGQEKRRFDLIAMDIFESDFIPERFESLDFLESLHSLLSQDGILLYNRLANTEKDIEKSNYFFLHKFKKTFPRAQDIKVKGNLMLANKPII